MKSRALTITRTVVGLLAASLIAASCSASTQDSDTSSANTNTSVTSDEQLPEGSSGAESAASDDSASPTEGHNDPASVSKVTLVTNWLFSALQAPLFAGEALGYFADEGIELELQEGQGSLDAASKVTAGAAQFGLIDPLAALASVGQGTDVQQVMSYLAVNPGGLGYIAERNELSSLKDIDGLTLGGNKDDAYFIILPHLLELDGATVNYDFTDLSASVLNSALVTGKIDVLANGISTAASVGPAAAEQGLTYKALNYADIGFEVPGFSLIVSSSWAADNSELVSGFVRAAAKSVLWAIDNPDQAVRYEVDAVPALNYDQQLAAWNDSVEPKISVTGSDYFSYTDSAVKMTLDFAQAAYDFDATGLAYKPITNEYVDQLPAEWLAGGPVG